MEPQQTKKGKNLFSFFKSRDNSPSSSNVDTPVPNEQPPSKCQRIEIDTTSIQSDPALRSPIWKYPVNQRDAFRRAYIEKGQLNLNLKSIHDPNVENKTVDFNTLGLNNFTG